MEMHIGTIIAKAIGVILLLLGLILIPAGRICFRQIRELLLWKPTGNLNEELKLWLEQAGNFEKITVSIIYGAIIRTYSAISAGRDSVRQTGELKCEADNFPNRIMYAMYTIIFRWHILPLIVGAGLILSGSLWLILVLPVAWILSILPFFPFFIVVGIYCLVSSWVYGGLVYSRLFSGSGEWYYVSSGVGVLCMFLVYIVIVSIIALPNRRAHY